MPEEGLTGTYKGSRLGNGNFCRLVLKNTGVIVADLYKKERKHGKKRLVHGRP